MSEPTYDDMKLLFFPDEDQEFTLAEQVGAMQRLIDSGQCWHMEGHVGRSAMEFIEGGLCTLGPGRHKDYWGQTVPSKFDVEPGSKGSQEYVDQHREKR